MEINSLFYILELCSI